MCHCCSGSSRHNIPFQKHPVFGLTGSTSVSQTYILYYFAIMDNTKMNNTDSLSKPKSLHTAAIQSLCTMAILLHISVSRIIYIWGAEHCLVALVLLSFLNCICCCYDHVYCTNCCLRKWNLQRVMSRILDIPWPNTKGSMNLCRGSLSIWSIQLINPMPTIHFPLPQPPSLLYKYNVMALQRRLEVWYFIIFLGSHVMLLIHCCLSIFYLILKLYTIYLLSICWE